MAFIENRVTSIFVCCRPLFHDGVWVREREKRMDSMSMCALQERSSGMISKF